MRWCWISSIYQTRENKLEKKMQFVNYRNRKWVPLFCFEQFLWMLLLLGRLYWRMTSSEAPLRHLLVRFWQVLHKKHRTCLSAKKLALWTKLSHFLHKYASSAWQYSEAWNPQSSQDIERDLVSHNEATCLGGNLLQKPPRFFSSRVPLHILRNFVLVANLA